MRGMDIDRFKLKLALMKRGLTQVQVALENNYSKFWMTSMTSRGHISDAAIEVLAKYGITKEEISA